MIDELYIVIELILTDVSWIMTLLYYYFYFLEQNCIIDQHFPVCHCKAALKQSTLTIKVTIIFIPKIYITPFGANIYINAYEPGA